MEHVSPTRNSVGPLCARKWGCALCLVVIILWCHLGGFDKQIPIAGSSHQPAKTQVYARATILERAL